LTLDDPSTIIGATVFAKLRAATIVGLSLVPCLAFWTALPQAHRHDADAHHAHATVHQHFASHDHDGVELSPDDDAHVTWLDGVAMHRAPLQSFQPLLLVVAYLDDAPVRNGSVCVDVVATIPPHGPPRRSLSLRAPPAPAAFAI
jgi:hypothetical protein